jgi:hypothetical protein
MKPMRHASKVCALLFTLALFPGATCRKGGGVENADAGARSKNGEAPAAGRGGTPDVSVEKPSDPFARIPRMTVEDLKKALDEGRAVAADVRAAEAFDEEHIPGAFSVPEDDWAAHAGELPKDKLVVVYCA